MTVNLLRNNTPGKRILDEKYRSVSANVILPQEIIQKIFRFLPFKNLGNTSLVSKQWNCSGNERLFIKLMIAKNLCFSPQQWNKLSYFKVVDDDEVNNSIKKLPDNILEILKMPAKAFPGKIIMDTHTLIYIPKNICGTPLTLLSFNNYLKEKTTFFNYRLGYQYLWEGIFKQEGDKLIESGYVLIANDVLPNSRNQSLENQKKMIQHLNVENPKIECQVNWRIPKLLEVIVSVAAKYLLTKTILFSNDPCTFVLCQEKMRANQVIIGGFHFSGYYIGQHFSKSEDNAIVSFCKL